MHEKHDTSFFADIKKYLLGLLTGLVSITTLLKYFINNTDKFFGLSIKEAYSVFICLYFIVPVLLSLFGYYYYFKINNNSFSSKRFKTYIAYMFTALIASFLYLWLPVTGVTFELFIFLSAFMVIYGLIYCVKLKILTIIPNNKKKFLHPERKEKYEKSAWLIIREYIIFYLITTAIFCFLIINFKPGFRNTLKYSYQSQNLCLEDLDNLKKRDRYFLFDESTRLKDSALYAYQISYAINKSSDYYKTSAILFSKDSIINVDSLKTKSFIESFTKNNVSNEEQFYLQARALDISNKILYSEITERVETKLVSLINALQLRSYLWFYALLILALNFWTRKRIQLVKNDLYFSPQNESEELLNKISATKAFIFLLITLFIPFFKPVDRDNINIDSPFINLSLKTILDGGDQPYTIFPITEKYEPVIDNSVYVDNRIYYSNATDSAEYIYEQQAYNDSLIKRILKNTHHLRDLIIEQTDISETKKDLEKLKKIPFE